ncbi:hypothetical protein MTO96_003607 [Rhipicephalus appendiculatus]
MLTRRLPPPPPDFGPLPGDVAYEELWALRRVLLDLDGTFDPLEVQRLALALQRHYVSGRMSPDKARRVYMALGLLGNSIGITWTASGATTTLPRPYRDAADEVHEIIMKHVWDSGPPEVL